MDGRKEEDSEIKSCCTIFRYVSDNFLSLSQMVEETHK